MTVNADRARSKLLLMSNTALINLANEYEVDVTNNGRPLSKKKKVAALMQCDEIIALLGSANDKDTK